jgi:hypothetical protein
MPGFLLHVGATIQCTHAASVTTAPAQPRVLVGGQPVATLANLLTVAGCPFQIPIPGGTKPQPCVRVQWTLVSARVLVAGQPALLQATPGPGAAVCQSAEQIPQGPPMVATLQTRVLAS